MLKTIRTITATVVFLLVTLLFLDFTGTIHTYFRWLAKIQFIPAILAVNLIVVITLLVLTLIFGRVYCSIICPLGIMQDVISRFFPRKKLRFSYSPALTPLRITMFCVFTALLIAGFGTLASLLEPYSTFGTITQNLLQPIYISLNNILAKGAESINSYAFYEREVWLRSLPALILSAFLFIIIAILAWKNGRTYCNTICPVGTLLGYISKFSFLKVWIDTDKCKKCGKCERTCKASCINTKAQTIDYTRCVSCGNCIASCSFGALKYSQKKTVQNIKKTNTDSVYKTPDSSRRNFLVGSGLAIAGTIIAQEKKKVDGGLTIIENKKQPIRTTKITPAGSISANNMAQRCTACQLCVSQCPNDVLRPDTELSHLMQPTMSYERGYCRPECNRCAEVCPTGAIKPITLADKCSTQIGHAVFIKANCLSVSEGISCGNCERHCPTGAIMMVNIDEDESKPMIPAIDESRCIGCGACENLCPSRPFSAIYVEGHEVHRTI